MITSGAATQGRWTSAVWETPAFEADLRAFVEEALGSPVALERVRLRPWSTVWRVTAGDGVFFAKQNCPGQAHEAALLTRIASWAPEHVVPVVAADPARDLLLTPDLGRTVRERGEVDVAAWCRITARAADLQVRLAPHGAHLGLVAMAPEDATTYVGDAIGRLRALPLGDPRRLDDISAARLEALLPTIGRWADEVADLDLPLTMNHNDLHPNNVLEPSPGDLRFFDLADAVLGEPLGALLIPLTMASGAFDAGPDDPRLARIADAALEPWSDLAPMARLRSALPAALQLARLPRVESWRRCVASMTDAERGEFGAAPAQRLGTLLEEPPWGRLP